MTHPKLKSIEDKQKRHDLPEIKPGMFIKIVQKVKEGEKTRNQTIEGLVIAKKHNYEIGSRMTVRRIVGGIGIEWTIPIHSPSIEKIEIIKESRVRRAKLYYMRRKSQRQTRIKLKKEAKTYKAIKDTTEDAPSETITKES